MATWVVLGIFLAALYFALVGLMLGRLKVAERADHRRLDDWPPHQPECFDAPIPGRQWYSGCEPGARVSPETGVCDCCGETACRVCGRQNCPDGSRCEAR